MFNSTQHIAYLDRFDADVKKYKLDNVSSRAFQMELIVKLTNDVSYQQWLRDCALDIYSCQ